MYLLNWHKEGEKNVSITNFPAGDYKPFVTLEIEDDLMKLNLFFENKEELQDFINKIVDANIDASFGKGE